MGGNERQRGIRRASGYPPKRGGSAIGHHPLSIINCLRLAVVVVLSLEPTTCATDFALSDPVQEVVDVVQDCMKRSPAPWLEVWRREYVDTIRQALSNDANQSDHSIRIEVFRQGFVRYWARTQGVRLTQAEYDVHKAEMRWYCESLMAEGFGSASEKAILRSQFHDLLGYSAEYLKGRFPFLTRDCVEEAKKATLADFEQEIESPLLPIFRGPFSESEVRTIKANWGRLYMRWFFIWRSVRYEPVGRTGGSAPLCIADHPHCVFARRCLEQLPRAIWPLMRPPQYVLDVTEHLHQEQKVRTVARRQATVGDRTLALHSSNRVEQVEQWGFVLATLLQTTKHGERECSPPSEEYGERR